MSRKPCRQSRQSRQSRHQVARSHWGIPFRLGWRTRETDVHGDRMRAAAEKGEFNEHRTMKRGKGRGRHQGSQLSPQFCYQPAALRLCFLALMFAVLVTLLGLVEYGLHIPAGNTRYGNASSTGVLVPRLLRRSRLPWPVQLAMETELATYQSGSRRRRSESVLNHYLAVPPPPPPSTSQVVSTIGHTVRIPAAQTGILHVVHTNTQSQIVRSTATTALPATTGTERVILTPAPAPGRGRGSLLNTKRERSESTSSPMAWARCRSTGSRAQHHEIGDEWE
jgi:hypothetical protein